MPNTANAKKALRQNEKRRLRNRAGRSALRTAIKKCRLAATGTKEEAQEAFRLAVKKLDQSAAKKLIHKNTASRLKSRLSAFVKKTQAAATAAPAAAGENA
jgi:small subunit ribosomal protein S20